MEAINAEPSELRKPQSYGADNLYFLDVEGIKLTPRVNPKPGRPNSGQSCSPKGKQTAG